MSISAGGATSSGGSEPPKPPRRRIRFDAALVADPIDKKVLADLTWSGVLPGLRRSEIWQLLLGYRPLTHSRWTDTIEKKRNEYRRLRESLYDGSPAIAAEAESATLASTAGEGEGESGLLKQIRKDLPRTQLRGCGGSGPTALLGDLRIRGLMERVLFVWAVRQPASGYVQGLNDVLTPLLVVGLLDASGVPIEALDASVLENLSEEDLGGIEADCYWCLTKILSEIFDHYTHGQPGIQKMVQRLKEIIRRIDSPLAVHFEQENTDISNTAFRWITCLMVRDIPMACCIRLWDTLIAESAQAGGQQMGALASDCGSPGFEALLVYFCACFTAYFSARLQALDFEGITFFLQSIPTDGFGESEMDVLLSEAYILKSMFQQAPRHLAAPEAR